MFRVTWSLMRRSRLSFVVYFLFAVVHISSLASRLSRLSRSYNYSKDLHISSDFVSHAFRLPQQFRQHWHPTNGSGTGDLVVHLGALDWRRLSQSSESSDYSFSFVVYNLPSTSYMRNPPLLDIQPNAAKEPNSSQPLPTLANPRQPLPALELNTTQPSPSELKGSALPQRKDPHNPKAKAKANPTRRGAKQ
ncbi:hypothetical protein CPB83DRAFT_886012 [Crepidotus variabilis]|uniref:Uncharacterized protein n=1 Tax=Crepidotus variabilis TaxID=179855 RepID=A0A9P6E9F8_9AGAR|nr:hypothetical protein CPB83DRAFT_886012 [Crepidotus variabilis]